MTGFPTGDDRQIVNAILSVSLPLPCTSSIMAWSLWQACEDRPTDRQTDRQTGKRKSESDHHAGRKWNCRGAKRWWVRLPVCLPCSKRVSRLVFQRYFQTGRLCYAMIFALTHCNLNAVSRKIRTLRCNHMICLSKRVWVYQRMFWCKSHFLMKKVHILHLMNTRSWGRNKIF